MKTRKTLFFIALLLALFAPNSMKGQSFVATSPSGHELLYYVISGTNEVEVRRTYSDISGNLVIPSTVTDNGTTYMVTSINSSAFENSTWLTSVTIPESVNTIWGNAFLGCSNLRTLNYNAVNCRIYSSWLDGCNIITLNIGNNVQVIPDAAFYGCTGLTSVIIPNSVDTIGEYAFYGCTGLTSVIIPNSVDTIGEYAFYGCTGLTSVTIPNSVTSIERNAFSGCTGLTSVTIPNSVTSIGWGAFYGCTGLTSVTIPTSVTSIGADAFASCTSLTSVTIPNSVTSIGGSAFYNCTGLTILNYNAVNCYIGSGWLSGCPITTLNIGDGVRVIPMNAFEYLPLASVTIPETIDSIGSGAFYYCSLRTLNYNAVNCGIGRFSSIGGFYHWLDGCNITTLNIGNNVQVIPESAFYNCTEITSVTIPNSVETIGRSAFYGCTGLSSVTIPNSVDTIGRYAFSGCTGLTTITIPESVTFIGFHAFVNCPNLSILNYNAVNCVIEDYNGSNWFSDYDPHIMTLNIGNSVQVIPEGAFRRCAGMTSVTIPNSVTSIGDDAFAGCTSLTSVTIPNSVTSIGDDAFAGCTSLTSATIPNSVTSIGDRAFDGCTGLTSATIGNAVTSIGEGAFEGCSRLSSVVIGNAVASIGENCFAECTGLRTITFQPTTPPSIESNSFDRVLRDVTVNVPCASLSAYQNAPYYDYFTNFNCSGNGGGSGTGGGNGGGNTGSDTTSVTHGDTVYVYVTIHDTVNTIIHDTAYITIHDTVCPEVNSISPTVISDINIYTVERQIVVEGAASMPVTFYDMQGRTLETKQSHGDQPLRFDAPATGVYMIRVANLPAQRVAILR